MNHPDIHSLANESSQCQYEAISTKAVCIFIMQSSAGNACKHRIIIFSLFTTIFYQKWPKYINTTIDKTLFLGKSVWWQDNHLLLANFSSKSSTINRLSYKCFHSTCAVDNRIFLTSEFIDSYSCTSMCYFLMVISHDHWSLSFYQLKECLFLSRNESNL